jgi:hypothetical protein
MPARISLEHLHSYTSILTPCILRLPQRYSDRHRDASVSVSIVGSCGSTPLHFAAANGHSNVVRTLFLHGAHADRADKHEVMPEMLARESGKEGAADVLNEWLDCWRVGIGIWGREREGDNRNGNGSRTEKSASVGALDCVENMVRKRLYVEQSIDHVLNSLKGYCPAPAPASAAEPASPLGEYTFYPPSRPDINTNDEISRRRPSLPHIYDDTIINLQSEIISHVIEHVM